MSFERDVSLEAFRAFAVAGTLAGEDVDVVLDRNVSYMDEDGQIRDRIIQASFDKQQVANAKFGQVLVIDGDHFKLARLEEDDGYIVKFEVHETTEAP